MRLKKSQISQFCPFSNQFKFTGTNRRRTIPVSNHHKYFFSSTRIIIILSEISAQLITMSYTMQLHLNSCGRMDVSNPFYTQKGCFLSCNCKQMVFYISKLEGNIARAFQVNEQKQKNLFDRKVTFGREKKVNNNNEIEGKEFPTSQQENRIPIQATRSSYCCTLSHF